VNYLYYGVSYTARIILYVFYRFKIYRCKNFPKGGALIACNHASFADPVIMGAVFKEEIGFLARKSLFRFPIFGAFIRKTNAIPISRGGVGAAAFRSIQAEVAKGRKVLIFPEGTRSKDGELQKVQKGIGVLALLTKSPIIPVYIHGTYEAWGRHMIFPKPWGRISCVIGEALLYDKSLYEDRELLSLEVGRRLKLLKEWLENGAKGDIP